MNEQYGGFSFNPRNWEYFKNKRLKKETKKDTLKQSRDRFKTLDEIDFFSWAEYFAREVAEGSNNALDFKNWYYKLINF